METIGTAAGFILTLMIFSYVLGDNFLYRLAVYVFVGLAAGYISIVTVESILLPLIFGEGGNILLFAIAGLLGLSLMFKFSPSMGWVGKFALTFLIAVGTAVAIVGAITGTLLPLTYSTGRAVQNDGLLNGIIVFIGVATSLVYFQYLGQRRPDGAIERRRLPRLMGTVGQGFIVVTLGALYASAILTSLTIFSGRVGFLLGGG